MTFLKKIIAYDAPKSIIYQNSKIGLTSGVDVPFCCVRLGRRIERAVRRRVLGRHRAQIRHRVVVGHDVPIVHVFVHAHQVKVLKLLVCRLACHCQQVIFPALIESRPHSLDQSDEVACVARAVSPCVGGCSKIRARNLDRIASIWTARVLPIQINSVKAVRLKHLNTACRKRVASLLRAAHLAEVLRRKVPAANGEENFQVWIAALVVYHLRKKKKTKKCRDVNLNLCTNIAPTSIHISIKDKCSVLLVVITLNFEHNVIILNCCENIVQLFGQPSGGEEVRYFGMVMGWVCQGRGGEGGEWRGGERRGWTLCLHQLACSGNLVVAAHAYMHTNSISLISVLSELEGEGGWRCEQCASERDGGGGGGVWAVWKGRGLEVWTVRQWAGWCVCGGGGGGGGWAVCILRLPHDRTGRLFPRLSPARRWTDRNKQRRTSTGPACPQHRPSWLACTCRERCDTGPS